MEQSLGPNDAELAAGLEGYALVLRKLKRKTEALEVETRGKALLAAAQVNK